ncbi:methyltransferase domain-containing protein [Rhodobacterales bacterium HKCCE3408]|nr:methyltransferase domain-containing protein [Rhodobacterales bacterium HKCCE3408]
MKQVASHHGITDQPHRPAPGLGPQSDASVSGRADRRGSVYDRLAPRYDRLHRRWLKYAGGEAQAALEGAVRALIRPNMDMLDVGCGNGALIRRLVADRIAPERICVVDTSQAMLDLCADLPACRVRAPMQNLPFPDASFDLLTCAWTLETITERHVAIREMQRVIRPGGWACVAFCAKTQSTSLVGWIMRRAVELRRAGGFLHFPDLLRDFGRTDFFQARPLPCRGPAAAMLVQRTVERRRMS